MDSFIRDNRLLVETPGVDDFFDLGDKTKAFSKLLDSIKTSVLFVFIGKFGMGKSTLIENVKRLRISQKCEDQWVNFDSWKFPDRKDLWEGFNNFITVKQLKNSEFNWKDIPSERGVYVVVYKKTGMPKFKEIGAGPVLWRGRIVNVSVEGLKIKWVDCENSENQIIYIGRASKKNTLRKRIKSYIKFGSDKSSSHYGGRYIWQIVDSNDLEVGWKKCDNPAEEERNMLNKFKDEHDQRLPFANLRNG